MVSAPREFQNIALIGFMGTGKTAVGRLVADRLRFDFVDTDELIEARAKKPIHRIFAEEGEARFREFERELVGEMSRWHKTVIATGGGLGANPVHLASLKAHALVICLWAAPETIYERVRRLSTRPLLIDPDPQGKIRVLLAERAPAYRQADVLLHTERRSLQEVVHQVIHQFRMVRRASVRA
jgi:shikimate kinase